MNKNISFDHLSFEQLAAVAGDLAWNDGFGCFTRPGLEKLVWPLIAEKTRWIIFLDVDNMHDLNDELGRDAVNALIKKSLVLRESDYVTGQRDSGDEFVVCITENEERGELDPVGLCERLQKTFLDNGIPATFGIAPVTSRDLDENVTPAYELVKAEKHANRRGRISRVAS